MSLNPPETGSEPSQTPGSDQPVPVFVPPQVPDSDRPIVGGPPFSDPEAVRFSSANGARETVTKLMENFHSIAKLIAESLSWGDPNDPQVGRALVNALRLAFRYGGEAGEQAMIADINGNLLGPLDVERIDKLPPISCGTSYQRVYILNDRQTGRSVPLAMFEIGKRA